MYLNILRAIDLNYIRHIPLESVTNRHMAKPGTDPQQISWDESLTFDEVAKFFSVPIAEAANILGVSSKVLKKISHDNGVPRWPYRKFLAGRTVEEIKREAVRDKEMNEEPSKASNENNKTVPSSGSQSVAISSTQVLTPKPPNLAVQNQGKTGNTVNETGRWQPGVATSGNILQPSGSRIPQAARQPYQLGHRAFISTYLDDFKQGFPKNGLSSVSKKWWGSSGSISNEDAPEDSEIIEAKLTSRKSYESSEGGDLGTTNENDGSVTSEVDGFLKEGKSSDSESISKLVGHMGSQDEDLMHISILSRTRKRKAENGRRALKLAVTNGYGTYKIGNKDKILLERIFGSPFPRQWKASLSFSDGTV